MVSRIQRKKRGTIFYARKYLRHTSPKSGQLHSTIMGELIAGQASAGILSTIFLLQMLMAVLIHSESSRITLIIYYISCLFFISLPSQVE